MLQFGVFRRFRFHGASGLDDLAVSTEDRKLGEGLVPSWLRPNSLPDLKRYAIPHFGIVLGKVH